MFVKFLQEKISSEFQLISLINVFNTTGKIYSV